VSDPEWALAYIPLCADRWPGLWMIDADKAELGSFSQGWTTNTLRSVS
jgi:hypothetical protein